MPSTPSGKPANGATRRDTAFLSAIKGLQDSPPNWEPSTEKREVYWLCEEDEDEDRRTSNLTTPSKRKRSEDDLVSPRSFKRKEKIATFDPSSDDD